MTMIDSPVLGTMDMDTAIMNEVAKVHADLINGLRELYSTLIEMRYLSADEVVYPPYGVSGKPAVALSQLRAAGFVPEAIALMELLPYPSNEALERWSIQDEGVPIAPDSGAMSYLEGHEWDGTLQTARQPLRNGETGLPAWAFKITFGARDWGTEYIYDTRTRTAIRWDSKSESTEYEHQPTRSPESAFRIMCNEMRSLDWIPWRDEREGFETLNIHSRPSLLSGVGAQNRFQECDGELETMQQERAKLREHVEEARRTNPTLDAAIMLGRNRSGTIGMQELKQLAIEHGVNVQKSTSTKPQPEGWGIGWVLDGVEQNAPDNKALRQKILSMRHASAQQLRSTALDYGVPIPEVPAPPPPPPAQSDPKLEVAKAVQNMFACKRQLFRDCGWGGEEFRSDEFERRRTEFEEEFHDFFTLLGPRGQNIHDAEEGAWLREWYRQRAGERAV